MLQFRQDLHLPRHILQGAPFCAFVFMYVLHSVHTAGTVTFLHDANLLAEIASKLYPTCKFLPSAPKSFGCLKVFSANSKYLRNI